MSLSAWLITFAVLCLLLALAVGLAVPRAWIWRWADPIYYPLAILGVVLLFIASERNRIVEDLRAQQVLVLRDLNDFEKSRPSATSQDIGSGFFKPSYDLLMGRAELGRACRFSAKVECFEAQEHEELITSVFKGFKAPESLADDVAGSAIIQDYCRRGFQLIDALETRTSSATIFGRLKSSFAELGKKNLSPRDFDVTRKSEEALRAELRAVGASVLPHVPDDGRDAVREAWEANASFAGNLHSALSMCLRIPHKAIEQLDALKRWDAEQAKRLAAGKELEQRIQKAQGEAPSRMRIVLAFILSWLWPFVLVIALSLKFAKGVASLR